MPIATGTALALGAGLSAAGGIGSSLIAKSGQKQQSSTTPQVSPEYAGLQQQLIQHATNRLNTPLPAGTLENGLRTINHTSDMTKQGLENDLTSRGLSTSPIAGNVLGRSEIARRGALTDFQNVQMPQLQQQFDQQNEDFASRVLAGGMGQNTTGVSTVNPVGAGLGSTAEMLAYMYGKGLFGGKTAGPAQSPFVLPPSALAGRGLTLGGGF